MKKLLLLFCLLIAVSGFSQRSGMTPTFRKLKNDTIIWKPDSLLHVTDFKAKPKNNGPLGASALAIIIYSDESGGELLFFVEALFVKSKSYIVKSTEYVLKHEQTHFDVAEVYARTLRKKIADTDFKKIKKVRETIDKLYNKTVQDYFKEQNNYDNDTEHGLNSAKQKIWNETIAQRLKDLDAYSNLYVNTAQ